MVERKPPAETIQVADRRDLRRHMREIAQRFNANPDIARLAVVNPILALEDIGIELTAEMKNHVRDALRFPKKLQERKAQLETELKEELAKLEMPDELPLSAERRAHLVFHALKLAPLPDDTKDPSRLESRSTRLYAQKHPLIGKLSEYERLRQGGLIFHTRETYEAYKAGHRRHRWLDSIRFKV